MLCFGCKWFDQIKGDRPSDEIYLCNCGGVPFGEIPFRVTQCSLFIPYKHAALNKMMRSAYILRVKRGKPIGFQTYEEFTKDEG